MEICVIGDRGSGVKAHFSECIVDVFREQNIKTDFLACEDIHSMIPNDLWTMYRSKKYPVPISKYLTQPYDFLFVDQCDLVILNDTKIPSMYNHKYIHRQFSGLNNSVIFFLTTPLKVYCEKIFNPYECDYAEILDVMPSAVDIINFQPKEKKFKGIVGIGERNDNEIALDSEELLQIGYLELYNKDVNKFRDLGFMFFESPISDLKYREILPQCEATWFSVPRGQYITRRMFQAMACKTLFIFQVQGKRHETVLRENGFENGEHYVGIKKMKDLLYLEELLTDEMMSEIVENAYKVVMERHTYEARAKQILEVFKRLKC